MNNLPHVQNHTHTAAAAATATPVQLLYTSTPNFDLMFDFVSRSLESWSVCVRARSLVSIFAAARRRRRRCINVRLLLFFFLLLVLRTACWTLFDCSTAKRKPRIKTVHFHALVTSNNIQLMLIQACVSVWVFVRVYVCMSWMCRSRTSRISVSFALFGWILIWSMLLTRHPAVLLMIFFSSQLVCLLVC